MKLTCSKDTLLTGIQIAQRCISSRAPLPILSGILLMAQDNQLIVQATDSELAVECTFSVEVIENGSVVVPARNFFDLVRRLPEKEIVLEYDAQLRTLNLTYELAQFSINTLVAEEFPALPDKPNKQFFHLPQNHFRELTRKVDFAASNDLLRPIFTGVFLEIAPDRLLIVATDTHRLAKSLLQQSQDSITETVQTVIPVRALNELNRLLKDEETPLKIAFSETQLLFETPEFSFYTRPIQGLYPDYQRVLPSEKLNTLTLKVGDLLPAIERASLLVSTKDGNSIVHLTIQDERMIINSYSANFGSIREEITIRKEGPDLEVSFNARYILDCLKIMDGEAEITMEFSGQLSPCIIRPISDEDYLYLLLPVRT